MTEEELAAIEEDAALPILRRRRWTAEDIRLLGAEVRRLKSDAAKHGAYVLTLESTIQTLRCDVERLTRQAQERAQQHASEVERLSRKVEALTRERRAKA